MDDFGLEKPRISKLTGSNYRSWSIQVMTLLEGQDLWDIVEGRLGKPIEGEEPPKDPKIRARDTKARSMIMSLYSQEALEHILLYRNASAQ
jgi:hypothetical protein